jgi:outer membrane protein TolC
MPRHSAFARPAGGRRRRLLRRRPDVRRAERQVAGATARVGIATAELYPQISIGASGGSIGLLSDLGDGKANTWGFGPLIRWTIPTGAARAAAKADTQAALASFDGTVLGALRETETALSNYAHDRDRLVALMQAREAANRASAKRGNCAWRARASCWPIWASKAARWPPKRRNWRAARRWRWIR